MRANLAIFAWIAALVGVEANAHPLNWTRLALTEPDEHGHFEARLEIDLARYLGGYEAYLEAAQSAEGGPVLLAAAERAWSDLAVLQEGRSVDWSLQELIPPPPDDGEFLAPLPAPMTFVRWAARGRPDRHATVSVNPETVMELPLVLRFPDTPERLPMFLSAGQGSQRYTEPRTTDAEPTSANEPSPAGRTSTLEVLRDYVGLGFVHILPKGLDHILFVLGLYLAGGTWRRLLLQVSAFTLAHTLTLALVTLDRLPAPPRLVEPLIALSIVWLAWDNLRENSRQSLRLAVVFAFGLLHGMGFAGVLAELGLPKDRLLEALLAFNVGVELGQLAVLGLAAVTLAWWRQSLCFRPRIVFPASLVIGATASWWTLERIINA